MSLDNRHPQGITTTPERRALPALGIWELAWPAILNNLLHALVGLVGIKIVGVLGASAVAAVTTGNRVFFVLQALLMAVTAGTTALVARAWGAGDRDEAERVNRVSMWVCLGISLAVTLPAFVFADPLARFFRLEEETVLLAATYIRWISLFNAGFALQFVLSVALRAAGDTRTPLWIGALTNIANLILLYLLVYGRLGFPALGVAGAAIAGGAAFAIGSLVFVYLWVRGYLLLGIGPPRCLERARVHRLVNIGYPAGLEQLVWQGGFIAFLWIVALYGTAPYAAYGIGVSILAFSFLIGWGFSIAASTLVGQHLGAGDPDGATRSGWRAARLSVISMVVRPRGGASDGGLHLRARGPAAAHGHGVRPDGLAARRRRHAFSAAHGAVGPDFRPLRSRGDLRLAGLLGGVDLLRPDRGLHRQGDDADAALPGRPLEDRDQVLGAWPEDPHF
jgi:putative MATE family efflux protein